MKKILLILILISLTTLTLADEQQNLGIYKSGDVINIIDTCINSSYSNVTRIVEPNSTFLINNKTSMTKLGNNYNLSFSQTSKIGKYLVYGDCDKNGLLEAWDYNFLVTKTGYEIVEGQQTIIMLPVIMVLLTALFFLFISTRVINQAIKTLFIGGSGFFFFFAIIFSLVIAGQLIPEFTEIVGGYTNYYKVITTFMYVGIIIIIILAFIGVIKRLRIAKGQLDPR